jgi:hypothetical protein
MSRDGREALDMRTAWTRRVAIEEVARQVSAEMKRTDQQGLDTFAADARSAIKAAHG